MLCRNGFLATVFSLLTLLPMAPFLYMELCTIAAYGWGWVGAWNVLDIISYVLQVCVSLYVLDNIFWMGDHAAVLTSIHC